MSDITFRPMPDEPPYQALGKDCRPDASHARMMKLLRYELTKIGATDVIIEAGFTADNIRQDGMPYSGARPSHSTVRLTFRKGGKTPMSFTCGGHDDWVQNLYLIAMTLERLRAVARYGCVQADQQYRGWAQLPPGGGIAAGEWLTLDAAARFLWIAAGWPENDLEKAQFRRVITDPEVLRRVYQDAAKVSHPDAGGTVAQMSKVNRARDFIESGGKP